MILLFILFAIILLFNLEKVTKNTQVKKEKIKTYENAKQAIEYQRKKEMKLEYESKTIKLDNTLNELENKLKNINVNDKKSIIDEKEKMKELYQLKKEIQEIKKQTLEINNK